MKIQSLFYGLNVITIKNKNPTGVKSSIKRGSKLSLLAATATLATTLALAGCGDGQNKLLTANPDSAAKFLYQAELTAMEQTHVYDSSGSIYVRCMQDPSHFNNIVTGAKGTEQCAKVFEAMVKYAHSHQHDKQDAAFKDISLSDLKNPLVVKRLSQKIQNLVMSEGQSDQ